MTPSRQAAIDAGADTYVSPEPCSRCGQMLERPTATGICPCQSAPPIRTLPFYGSRMDARAMGFEFYVLIGTKCSQGHIDAPRYVLNAQCLDCRLPPPVAFLSDDRCDRYHVFAV